MTKTEKTPACPCGSGASFDLCCRRFLAGKALPQTPLELMRSRYTAYTCHDSRYIRQTWYPGSRPEGAINTDTAIKWTRLEIIRSHTGQNDGLVEFIAHCKINGRAQKMHETSRFLRENGQWYYLDGTFNE